jgi:nitroimidazol reductase NimA-like FMN-containing flavoprotein (pyridoxamine 5'-phosphate oxidase superfamily)
MFKEMRRNDREITDAAQIVEVMKECEILHLGLRDGDGIYVVPLHFGIAGTAEAPVLYTHSIGEGHKMDLVAESDYGFVQMDCDVNLQTADMACGFSSSFKSVMAECKVTRVEDNEEKRTGLLALMEHYSGKADWDIPEAALGKMGILKIEVLEMTCKVHD